MPVDIQRRPQFTTYSPYHPRTAYQTARAMYRGGQQGWALGKQAYKAGKSAYEWYKGGRKAKAKKAKAKIRVVRSRTRTVTRRRYHTTGGSMRRFRRTRRQDVSYNAGSTYIGERGGVVSDDQCVYVGHSTTAWDQISLAACRAIVWEAMHQKNKDIIDWSDLFKPEVGVTEDFRFTYYVDFAAGTISGGSYINILDSDTCAGVAIKLRDELRGILSTTSRAQMVKFEVQRTDNQNTSPVDVTIVSIDLSQFYLDLQMTSTIKIQNRTVASDSVPNAQDELVTDVENNPLVGKKYYSNANGFLPRFRNSGSYQALVANFNGANISATAGNLGDPQFKSPPNHRMFIGCKRTVAVKLMPGQIKHSTLRSSYNSSFTKLVSKYVFEMDEAVNTKYSWFGNSELFAFELSLDSGASEPNISIGYQTKYYLKCGAVYRKNRYTHAILDIP